MGCKDLNDVALPSWAGSRSGCPERCKTISCPWPLSARRLSGPWCVASILDRMGRARQAPETIPRRVHVVTNSEHGKSVWVLNLAVQCPPLCMAGSQHYSPRKCRPCPICADKLRRIKGSSRPDADAFIDEYFRFIDSDPTGREDEDFDLDWIIDKATDAVLRDGIRCLVIDPWNEVEHARRRDETMTDYIGRGIRSLKRFARLYDVAVIVIAHPTKDIGKDGKSRAPTLYDIEGSAHWFNKCDHGVVIDRPKLLRRRICNPDRQGFVSRKPARRRGPNEL